MGKGFLKLTTVLILGLTVFVCPALADKDKCNFELVSSGDETGSAEVTIKKNKLKIEIEGAIHNALYTIWIDHKNRATMTLADDYPDGGLERGVAPAFPTTAGVTSGMGPDLNSFTTDYEGDAVFMIKLDYNILKDGDSPVVAEDLVMQGMNRIGGGWLRSYVLVPALAASVQRIDAETGLPVLPRSTAQGITIVRHEDSTTHGHTPGVGDVDHFPAFKGDFPSHCK